MKITREELEHVAHLSRLNLDEEELTKMTKQLDTILQYVEKLNELDTSSVQPTTHAFSIYNAFREDEVKESLLQQDALENCLDKSEDSFKVPRII